MDSTIFRVFTLETTGAHCIYLHSTLKVWSGSSSPLEAILLINPRIYKKGCSGGLSKFCKQTINRTQLLWLSCCLVILSSGISINLGVMPVSNCTFKMLVYILTTEQAFKVPICKRADSSSLIPSSSNTWCLRIVADSTHNPKVSVFDESVMRLKKVLS